MAVRYYNNRDEFYTAVKQLLGAPVINIEITSGQYDAVFEEAIEEFRLYGDGAGGSYEDYAFLTVTSGVSAYPATSANGLEGIIAVKEYTFPGGLGNVNQIFTSEHNLLTDQSGRFRLFNTEDQSFGLQLASYQAAMQYLELVKELLSKEYIVKWRQQDESIIVTPTPKDTTTGLLTLYRGETELNIMNNVLFKNLFKAKLKHLWGSNLGKYAVTMPGGGTVNYDRIIEEAIAEEEKALNEIKSQAFPTPFSIY